MRVTTIDRAVFFTAGVCLGLAAGLPLGLVAAEPKTDDMRADVAEHVPADYARLGFEERGPDFDEAGIPHVEMVRRR